MAAGVVQATNNSGDTIIKNQFRELLISQTMDCIRRTLAYASNINNYELQALVKYNESDLKKCSDSTLENNCRIVHFNVNANLSELETYGVTTAMITGLQTTINNFDAAIPKKRIDTITGGMATRILAGLFKTLSANWAKIDLLVGIVRTSQPNSYNEYKSIRKVIRLSSGVMALKIKVINAQTGEPEAKVKLSILPDKDVLKKNPFSGKKTLVRKTAKGGGVNIQNMANGTYLVTAQKFGFKDATGTVYIVSGEMFVLEIRMELG
jgi:hypothetical protein